MKTRLLFLTLVWALLFAGCSKESDSDSETRNPGTTGGTSTNLNNPSGGDNVGEVDFVALMAGHYSHKYSNGNRTKDFYINIFPSYPILYTDFTYSNNGMGETDVAAYGSYSLSNIRCSNYDNEEIEYFECTLTAVYTLVDVFNSNGGTYDGFSDNQSRTISYQIVWVRYENAIWVNDMKFTKQNL